MMGINVDSHSKETANSAYISGFDWSVALTLLARQKAAAGQYNSFVMCE